MHKEHYSTPNNKAIELNYQQGRQQSSEPRKIVTNQIAEVGWPIEHQ
jgi:hypothetical protein